MSLFASVNLNSDVEKNDFHFFGNIYEIKGIDVEPDTDLKKIIIEGYKEQGGRFFSRLRGEFALFLRLNNKWVLATDPLGIVPLYYYLDQNQLFVGSWLNDFVFLKLTANQKYIDAIYEGRPVNNGQSCFNEINKLLPGHFIEITQRSFEQNKYYELGPVNHSAKNTNQLQEELNKLLLTSLARRSKKRQAVLLSGGVCSSVLYKISDRLGNAVKSMSILLPGNEYAEEKWCLDEVIESTRSKSLQLNYGDIKSQTLDEPSDLHFYNPKHSLFKPIMKKAADTNMEILISGFGGQEVFSAAITSSNNNSIKFKLSNFLKHLANAFCSFVFNKNCKTLQSTKFNDLFLSNEFSLNLESQQQLAQSCGLLLSYPFLDIDIVEWAMGLDEKYLNWNDLDKVILREVAKNYLTKEHCQFDKKTKFENLLIESIQSQRQTVGTRILKSSYVANNLRKKKKILNWLTSSFEVSDAEDMLKINYIEKIKEYSELN